MPRPNGFVRMTRIRDPDSSAPFVDGVERVGRVLGVLRQVVAGHDGGTGPGERLRDSAGEVGGTVGGVDLVALHTHSGVDAVDDHQTGLGVEEQLQSGGGR